MHGTRKLADEASIDWERVTAWSAHLRGHSGIGLVEVYAMNAAGERIGALCLLGHSLARR